MPAVSIELQIPTYLHKFLTTQIGHPYRIKTNEHSISRFIIRNLSGKMLVYSHSAPDKEQTYLHAPFTIIIPPRINETKWTWTINQELEDEFRTEVDNLFMSMLGSHIAAYQQAEEKLSRDNIQGNYRQKLSTKAAISDFLDLHGIGEMDIRMETLIKRCQRMREKQRKAY